MCPLYRCKHNEVYWKGDEPYYAFGLGAASYLRSRRFSRPGQMIAYRKWVSQFATSGVGFAGELILENPWKAVMLNKKEGQ
jgi:coproporphyrinogen III oxidase-like Fe-S oxidoreductase